MLLASQLIKYAKLTSILQIEVSKVIEEVTAYILVRKEKKYKLNGPKNVFHHVRMFSVQHSWFQILPPIFSFFWCYG